MTGLDLEPVTTDTEPVEVSKGERTIARHLMKGYIYILLCSNGQYYTGSTNNIERRLVQHQNGEGSNYTKIHLPVELVYVEEFDNIKDAFYREKQIQGWSRKKKEALINGEYSKLPELSKNVPSTGSGTRCGP